MNKLVCSCLYVPLISEQGANMSYMTTVLSVTRSLYLTGRKPEKLREQSPSWEVFNS